VPDPNVKERPHCAYGVCSGPTDFSALESSAERLVGHASGPVLVVRPPTGSARCSPIFKKDLVPIDFSACAAQGLAYAKALST
jgi:hypothetical protein